MKRFDCQRDALVLAWRDRDHLTFGQIAAELGVSVSTALKIYRRAAFYAANHEGTIMELSYRSRRILMDLGLPYFAGPEQVAEVLPQLRDGVKGEHAIYNFGQKSLQEIEDWLRHHRITNTPDVDDLGNERCGQCRACLIIASLRQGWMTSENYKPGPCLLSRKRSAEAGQ